jgi:hypothetical protein
MDEDCAALKILARLKHLETFNSRLACLTAAQLAALTGGLQMLDRQSQEKGTTMTVQRPDGVN